MRSRIRTTLYTKHTQDKPTDVHLSTQMEFEGGKPGQIHLPILALNEVFVSEHMSAKTSHFSISSDEQVFRKTKSSGICVATGTGSTSWHYSMNRLPVESVAKLLSLMNVSKNTDNKELAKNLSDTYNQHLLFKAGKALLNILSCYLLSSGLW